MVGPAGVIRFLDLHFDDARVDYQGRFGTSDGVVVVVGNDTGFCLVWEFWFRVGLGCREVGGVRLCNDALNGGGGRRNWAWS